MSEYGIVLVGRKGVVEKHRRVAGSGG